MFPTIGYPWLHVQAIPGHMLKLSLVTCSSYSWSHVQVTPGHMIKLSLVTCSRYPLSRVQVIPGHMLKLFLVTCSSYPRSHAQVIPGHMFKLTLDTCSSFFVIRIHFCQWASTVRVGLNTVPIDACVAAAVGTGVPKLLAPRTLQHSWDKLSSCLLSLAPCITCGYL